MVAGNIPEYESICINANCKYWRGRICEYRGYCIWRKNGKKV
ncbi:hypothetical protein [Ferroglobus sp.]|nr:hypothetical protein [Ferroglobus sp.]